MRKIVVHMQSTLDNRIANAQGAFWEPFPWGEPEVAYVNQFSRTADTWALSRVMYDAIVPWWDSVATGQLPADALEITPAFAEFAQLQRRMTKVVFSNTMQSGDGRIVIRGDLVGQLAVLKQQDGVDIILSCGPATLGPIASTPGLVDEYLIAVHPAVITAGPRMFDRLSPGSCLGTRARRGVLRRQPGPPIPGNSGLTDVPKWSPWLTARQAGAVPRGWAWPAASLPARPQAVGLLEPSGKRRGSGW